MTTISLIAVIDENRGLGKANQLLCHLPADLKHFKELTLGKPVIMGRKTYESIGKALPGRHNIVISTQDTLNIADASVVHSLSEAIKLTDNAPEVMIIGGAKIFELAMNLAARIYLTQIHHQFAADVFFPIIDKNQWVERGADFRNRDEKNEYEMTFYRYDKII